MTLKELAIENADKWRILQDKDGEFFFIGEVFYHHNIGITEQTILAESTRRDVMEFLLKKLKELAK